MNNVVGTLVRYRLKKDTNKSCFQSECFTVLHTRGKILVKTMEQPKRERERQVEKKRAMSEKLFP